MEEVQPEANGKIACLMREIKEGNLSGSLRFLETSLDKFSRNYYKYKKLYGALTQSTRLFYFENGVSYDLGRTIMQVMRDYLSFTIRFCRKLEKLYPSSSEEYLMNVSKEDQIEIDTGFENANFEIQKILSEVTNKCSEMFAKYLSVKIKSSPNNKQLLEISSYPDINDINADIDEIHENIIGLKNLYVYALSLFIKDLTKIDDIDKESNQIISQALADVKADLEKAESIFVNHVKLLNYLALISNRTQNQDQILNPN